MNAVRPNPTGDMNQVAVEYIEVLQRSIQTADKEAWSASRTSLIDNAMDLVVAPPDLVAAATELRSMCEGFRAALQTAGPPSRDRVEALRKRANSKASDVASLLTVAEPSQQAKDANLP